MSAEIISHQPSAGPERALAWEGKVALLCTMLRTLLKSALCLLPPCLVLAACTLGPDFDEPDFDLPKNFSYQGMTWNRQAPGKLPKPQAWWDLYRDHQLTQLVDAALEKNATLDAASARLEQARATSQVARSRYFPNITIGQDARRTKSVFRGPGGGSIYYSSYEVPLEFSYELDLWGKVRRQVESARAREAAAQESLRALQLTIAGEVAQTYWALRAVDADRQLYDRTIKLRHEALELIGKQRDAGAISDLEYTQAETEVAIAESDRLQLDQERVQLVNALAVLTGRMAGRLRLADRPELPNPPDVPVQLPSEVLQQRPDVRAALHEVAAANAEIGVVSAAMFPSFSINASLGVEAAKMSDLLQSDALVWSLGSNILLPLTSQKLLRHQREAVRQAHKAVSADYRQIVLESVAEVENALQSAAILQGRRVAQDKAVEAAQSSFKKSTKRYQAGLVSFLNVVDAQRSLLDAQRKANAIQAESLALSVSLIKAIGGRW